MKMMPARLQAFALITVLMLSYVVHWISYDMALFLNKPSDYASATAPTVNIWNPASDNNSSVDNKVSTPEHHHQLKTNQQETVSERMVTNDVNTDYRGSHESIPTIDKEETTSKAFGDGSLWESLWKQHEIPGFANGTSEVAIHEREEIWKQLLNKDNTNQLTAIADLYTAFSPPRESVQHYNEDAYNSLISDILQAQRDGSNFTIVASGGSATAGRAKRGIPQEHRYYAKFASHLNSLLSWNQANMDAPPTVQFVGQGHGFRNSLHTAIFFDSFIPVHSDLLIWEFSINDVVDGQNEDLMLKNARANILAFLYRVKRMKKNPPKVILIYKWDTGYPRDNKTNEVICHTFDAHGNMARQFDFVVGHVHMGKYIDKEFDMPECHDFSTCPLVSDYCHISELGHLALGFLLLNIVDPRRRLSFPHSEERNFDDDVNYEWSCGNETEAKRVLKEVMTVSQNSSTEWRPPLGAWTLELPVYDQVTQRRLQAGPGLGGIHLMGKQDPMRQDRQRNTYIFTCDVNASNSFSVIAPLEPMTAVRVVLLTFRTRPILKTKGIDFRLNGSNETSKGQLVPIRTSIRSNIMDEWPCALPYPWGDTVDVYVYIFDTVEPSVHSMELCTPRKFAKNPQIQSLAFW